MENRDDGGQAVETQTLERAPLEARERRLVHSGESRELPLGHPRLHPGFADPSPEELHAVGDHPFGAGGTVVRQGAVGPLKQGMSKMQGSLHAGD